MAIDMKESLKTINWTAKVQIKQIIYLQQKYLGLMRVIKNKNQVSYSMRAKRFTKDSGRIISNMVKGRWSISMGLLSNKVYGIKASWLWKSRLTDRRVNKRMTKCDKSEKICLFLVDLFWKIFANNKYL